MDILASLAISFEAPTKNVDARPGDYTLVPRPGPAELAHKQKGNNFSDTSPTHRDEETSDGGFHNFFFKVGNKV